MGGRWARWWRRWSRRVWRVQQHCVFEADARTLAPPQWPADETPVRFTRQQPLSDELRRRLLAVRRYDGPYLDDVQAGTAAGLIVLRNADGAVVHSGYLMFGNKTACLLGWGRRVGLIGNSYTAEDHRGRGCQGRSARERIAMAANAGVATVISETSPDNEASRRGLLKAGMRPVGEVRFVVLLNTLVFRTRRPTDGVAAFDVCV